MTTPSAPAEAWLERLAARIAERRSADPTSSYTAKLLSDPGYAARKFGEEAIETLVAALSQDQESLASESADLLYHWLVLLETRGVSLAAVARVLQSRENRSGLEEKASRGG